VLDFCEAGDQAPGPYDILASRHSLERLKAGLEVMPTKTRTILLAQRLDGMTYSQIAEQQGLSQSAVEKHIARAMLFLQQWMQDW
jgi:RNA polymerase sigma-70 factor (ECF subfamily)